MPGSHAFQITTIVELIGLTDPQSVLDVGVACGTYGFLTRQYLYFTPAGAQWTRRVDGIEAFEPYIGEIQRKLYDNIYIGNALDVIPKLDIKYDLALLIDVLEHFEYEQGMEILHLLSRRARNVIVSTPMDIAVQGAIYGNEYEIHRFQFRKKHFREFEPRFFVRDDYSMICYFGEDAPRVRSRRNREHAKALFRRVVGYRNYRRARKLLGLP